ncbi:hypothetical protein GGS20DRAFT_6563 [Poronia punctata]|nr:hypothetical protein GGS20DRAFT_6563 [Poronia punctata]
MMNGNEMSFKLLTVHQTMICLVAATTINSLGIVRHRKRDISKSGETKGRYGSWERRTRQTPRTETRHLGSPVFHFPLIPKAIFTLPSKGIRKTFSSSPFPAVICVLTDAPKTMTKKIKDSPSHKRHIAKTTPSKKPISSICLRSHLNNNNILLSKLQH